MKDFEFPAQFLSDVANEAVGDVERLAKPFMAKCESPIEVMFIGAFRFFAKLNNYRTVRGDDQPELLPGQTSLPFDFDIWEQYEIEDFRVDFLIGFGERHVIVECDGKDFHHAKREQIDRDRERDAKLHSLGYKVVRFPGTQIYNDPMHCAADVLLWLVTGKFLSR